MINHASAFNRVMELAKVRDWLSDKQATPKMTTKGEKSVARPAFNRAEINQLLAYMETWATLSSSAEGCGSPLYKRLQSLAPVSSVSLPCWNSMLGIPFT